MTAQFFPFADDSGSSSIGSLVIENGRDKIALYGNLDITRDKAGLELARELLALVTKVTDALRADPNLPDQLPPAKRETVRNPFH